MICENRHKLIILLFLMALSLGFAKTSHALPTYRVLHKYVFKNHEFQLKRPAVELPVQFAVSPTFILHQGSGWTTQELIYQLDFANFILSSQCGVKIVNPTVYFVSSSHALTASYYRESGKYEEHLSQFEELLGPLAQEKLSLPVVSLNGPQILESAQVAGWAIITNEGSERMNLYLPQDRYRFMGGIMLAYNKKYKKKNWFFKVDYWLFKNHLYPVNPEVRYSALAHELVHSLSNLSHENETPNLMQGFPKEKDFKMGNGYIIETYCKEIHKSHFLKPL